MRYVTDYIRHLEIGIVHHLLVECNIFSMLVPLLEEKLWLRTNSKGEREIFENSRWVVVPKGEYGRLPKTEAQVWIAIYNLFMDPECRKKYELNDERKNTLLRVSAFSLSSASTWTKCFWIRYLTYHSCFVRCKSSAWWIYPLIYPQTHLLCNNCLSLQEPLAKGRIGR